MHLPTELAQYSWAEPCSVNEEDYSALSDLLHLINTKETVVTNEATIAWLRDKQAETPEGQERICGMLKAYNMTQSSP